jgi:hypothetical protein
MVLITMICEIHALPLWRGQQICRALHAMHATIGCHDHSTMHLASTLAAGPAHTYADGLARSGSCLVAVAGPSLCPGGRPAPAAAHPSAPHIIIKQTLHGHRIQSPRPRAQIIRGAGRGGGTPCAVAGS